MGPIEDFANPSSLDHDAATNYGLLADAVDDVRVGQQKPVVSHGPHVASRARAGNPSHSGSAPEARRRPPSSAARLAPSPSRPAAGTPRRGCGTPGIVRSPGLGSQCGPGPGG